MQDRRPALCGRIAIPGEPAYREKWRALGLGQWSLCAVRVRSYGTVEAVFLSSAALTLLNRYASRALQPQVIRQSCPRHVGVLNRKDQKDNDA